jgi:acyl-CoA-binding protein
MAPAPATRRARSWTSWFLAVGTAVGVGAVVYRYHRSAERLRRDDERRRDDDDDAAPTAAAAAWDRPSPARSSASAAPSPRPTKKEKQQAAASRAQLELLASFDGASGSVDPADAAFARAATRVETIVRRLSAPDKLRVYALYKQATEGPCSAPKPRLMDGLTKHAKWSAWKDLGDLPPEDAEAAYVRLVDQLAGGTDEGADEGADESADEGADDGGFGGPVFSRPEMPVAERTEAAAARAAARAAAAAASPSPSASPSASASDQFIDPDAVDPHGFLNPLSDACRRGDLSAVRRAAAAGSDPNGRDDEGLAPLHWAADGGHAGVIAALLAMGAEVDAVDDEGQTALHYAATVESAESCRLLLEAGADPEAEDDDGDTPESLGAIALAKTTPGA